MEWRDNSRLGSFRGTAGQRVRNDRTTVLDCQHGTNRPLVWNSGAPLPWGTNLWARSGSARLTNFGNALHARGILVPRYYPWRWIGVPRGESPNTLPGGTPHDMSEFDHEANPPPDTGAGD